MGRLVDESGGGRGAARAFLELDLRIGELENELFHQPGVGGGVGGEGLWHHGTGSL
jgi:hypothetical protein